MAAGEGLMASAQHRLLVVTEHAPSELSICSGGSSNIVGTWLVAHWRVTDQLCEHTNPLIALIPEILQGARKVSLGLPAVTHKMALLAYSCRRPVSSSPQALQQFKRGMVECTASQKCTA